MRRCNHYNAKSVYCRDCRQAFLNGPENIFLLRCPRKPFVGKKEHYVSHKEVEKT